MREKTQEINNKDTKTQSMNQTVQSLGSRKTFEESQKKISALKNFQLV